MPIPRDDLVGNKLGEQERRERVAEERECPRREASQAGRSGVQDKPVDRERPTVDLAARVPETDPLLAGGAGDAQSR